MRDKVQKIKDWICKEQDGLMDALEYPEHEGAYHILCNLDAYIDSLQEEPVSVWHDKDEEPDEDKQVLVCLSGYCYVDFYHKEDKRFYRFYMFGKPKHYLCEVDKWAYIDDLLNLSNVQRTVKDLKEPERIRKVLVELISTYLRGNENGKIHGVYAKDILAWLEKQISQDNAEDVDILHRFSFYSYKDEPNVLYLSGVYVNEEYRNKGIGTKILEVADEDREEFEEKLKDLYRFIRKFDKS